LCDVWSDIGVLRLEGGNDPEPKPEDGEESAGMA